MLFNSYPFIFVFLPIALAGFALIGRTGSHRGVIGWLITCSVAFYGVWNPVSLAIIAPSIAVNYALARWIQAEGKEASAQRRAGWILAAGVAFNVCFLGYFKYKNFFIETINETSGTHWPLLSTLLPLGISFITFQKIAFLVDVRAGAIERFSKLDFLTFVFFFPQLIAGPIVHYREMMPQFDAMDPRLQAKHLAVGLCLFAIGLFKKTMLADGIAPYVSSIFASAEHGEAVGLANAWIGALAYTLQIYFDFSGYSDMAIGLARMFGIRLPANFDSPLKAASITEFWLRWHMTLTRFLMAYVYTPLVMRYTRARLAQRKPVIGRGPPTLAAFTILIAWPTMVTMGLSGLWHGAGWTFVLWGVLHGCYLIINHAWRLLRPKWDKKVYERRMLPIGFALTFIGVVVAMVLFRARTLSGALRMYESMLGLGGVTLPEAVLTRLGAIGRWLTSVGVTADLSSGATLAASLLGVAALLAIALILPNSLETMARFEPAINFDAKAVQRAGALPTLRFAAALEPRWAVVVGVIFSLGLLCLNSVSEFLYWQF